MARVPNIHPRTLNPATAAVGRAPSSSDQPNVVPTAAKQPRRAPPGNDFRKQASPPPKGIGAQNVARLLSAKNRLSAAIKALEALPECRAKLLTACDALGSALLLQAKASSEYAEVLEKERPALESFALGEAKRAETRNPTGERDAVATHQAEIVSGVLAEWPKRFEQQVHQRAERLATGVTTSLAAARLAIEKAEFRAKLDARTPEATLAETVRRSVVTLPTLLQPAKALELFSSAMRLDQADVLLALSAVVPDMQRLVEGHLPGLTKNVGAYRAGQPSDAMAAAVSFLNQWRAWQAQTLGASDAGKARVIFEALEFLVIKTIGRDLADPAVVPSLGELSPARLAALQAAQLTPDTGKGGARWVSRYIRSTSTLHLPPLLADVPMANLEKNPPPGNRTPALKGNPQPLKPVTPPMRIGTPNPMGHAEPSASRRATGRD